MNKPILSIEHGNEDYADEYDAAWARENLNWNRGLDRTR